MNIKKVYLNHRTVLKISGIDPITFLNNILSSDIKLLKPKEILPSAILSPQGRILFDIMITFGQQHNLKNIKYVLLECDKSQTKCLITKIEKYNLRKEITITKTNYKVFVTNNLSNFKNSLIDKRFFNNDIGRMEDVHFNPWFCTYVNYVYTQSQYGRAFAFGSAQASQYVFNTFAFAYSIGYHFMQTSANGSIHGNFLGIGADSAFNVTLKFDAMIGKQGIIITNGEFTAHNPTSDSGNPELSPLS